MDAENAMRQIRSSIYNLRGYCNSYVVPMGQGMFQGQLSQIEQALNWLVNDPADGMWKARYEQAEKHLRQAEQALIKREEEITQLKDKLLAFDGIIKITD